MNTLALLGISFFVPASALLCQAAIAVIGAALLLCGPKKIPSLWLAAFAYPVGAVLVGLIQQIAFLSDHSSAALPAIAFAGIALALTAGVRLWQQRAQPREPNADPLPWKTPLLLTVALAVVAGFFIMQSSDLAESDPRWQWGYRALIIATHPGPDTPLITDPTVLHLNRNYPLLFSSLEAVTLRVAGVSQLSSLRSISFAFFTSALLLIAALAIDRRNAKAGTLCLLAFLALPKLWSLGVDEVYVDVPLGVCAAGLLLSLTHLRQSWPGLIIPILLGLGVASLKSEGIVLDLVIVACVLARTRIHPNLRAALPALLPLAGAAIALLLHHFYVGYIDLRAPIENVQLSDLRWLPPATLAHRYGVILRAFARLAVQFQSVGLFFPVILAMALVARSKQFRLYLSVAAIYLLVMSFPFIFSKLPLQQHLNVVVTRLYFQVAPILTLALFEGLLCLREPSAAPLAAA